MESFKNINLEVSEIELSYKSKVKAANRPSANSSLLAARVLFHAWDKSKIELQEQFKILLLNHSKKVLGICEISTGGVGATVVDPKLIYAAALKAHASSIILSHNHPSGNLKPSQADISITKQLQKAGTFLELPIVDHIILTTQDYYSFADEGLL
jgi:DNA repair protein RadC